VVLGRAPVEPLPRSNAEPGWCLAVTGPLGAAAIAVRERRPFRLLPRFDEGERLARLRLVAGDISDGLHQEVVKFGLGAVIDVAALPLAPGADWQTAVGSGEEAELVVAAPRAKLEQAGLRPVGELRREPGLTYQTPEGPVAIAAAGYEHFRAGN
jgi:thiamine monophosphate kinase